MLTSAYFGVTTYWLYMDTLLSADALLFAGRMVTAAVFIIAGITKLFDRKGTYDALINFGVPTPYAPLIAISLPIVEIIVAVLLIPIRSAWWGATAATVLLSIFTIAILLNLFRGNAPDCNCFGQLKKEPISWKTVARNVILTLISGAIVAFGRTNPGYSILDWAGGRSFLEVVGVLSLLLNVVVAAGLGFLCFQLWLQQARMLNRLLAIEERYILPTPNSTLTGSPSYTALSPGEEAPDFTIKDIFGSYKTRDEVVHPTQPTMLLFLDPGCKPCMSFLPRVNLWRLSETIPLSFIIISRGTITENANKILKQGFPNVLLQKDREVAEAYYIEATPSAVVVQPGGNIDSLPAVGEEAISQLVAVYTQASSTPAPKSTHEETPVSVQTITSEKFNSLTGDVVSFKSFAGRETLVLFWDSDCSFCKQILPSIKAWEALPPPSAPQLVFIARGTVEQNKHLGIKSPVLLDEDLSFAQSLDITGTPSAVLLDENLHIISPIASGVVSVLQLLKSRPLLEQVKRNGKP